MKDNARDDRPRARAGGENPYPTAPQGLRKDCAHVLFLNKRRLGFSFGICARRISLKPSPGNIAVSVGQMGHDVAEVIWQTPKELARAVYNNIKSPAG